VNYQEYIKSHAWRLQRGWRLLKDKNTCQKCGRKHELEVHHLTYDRLGQERDEDLQTLCVRCHNDVHSETRDKASEFMILNQTPITEKEYKARKAG